MTTTAKTTDDHAALSGAAMAHDRSRALLGQVMGLVAVVVGFAAFLFLLELFGGQRD